MFDTYDSGLLRQVVAEGRSKYCMRRSVLSKFCVLSGFTVVSCLLVDIYRHTYGMFHEKSGLNDKILDFRFLAFSKRSMFKL